jgi:hypothetical protein
VVYQPLIVGLGAVVLASLGSTAVEWFKHGMTARHAAETLRRGLIEELRLARDNANVTAEGAAEPEEGGSFLIPVATEYPIYDANISSLGKLEPAEVSAVVRAYGMLRAQVETLAVVGTFHRNESPVLHAVVDSKWSEVLAANTKAVSEAATAAIRALEGT